MKKIIIFALILTCASIFLYSKRDEGYRIAILTPASHPSLEAIEAGFQEEFGNDAKYVTYNSHGNKTLMRSNVEEIIRQDYDLVLTLGTLASQMTSEVFSRKNVEIPIVYTAVNVNTPLHYPEGQQITGAKEITDFYQEIALLQRIHPRTKRILLVYDASYPGLERDREQVAEICADRGIKLTPVQVFLSNEIQTKTLPFINRADAIMVLKDHTVISGLEALVKLANRHGIPLLASDLDSPYRGASIGFGVYERDFGTEAAKLARSILQDHVKACDIPAAVVDQFDFVINYEAAAKQGLEDIKL